MKTVHVHLGERSYDIYVGSGCFFEDSEGICQRLSSFSRVLFVTNETLYRLYEKTFLQLYGEFHWCILPDGESYKQTETLLQILRFACEKNCDRSSAFVALGGGVIGDMTGLAAGLFMRGIPFFQVPTTLLSQVDSSVGGKVGINDTGAKNIYGLFYQPKAVWIDPLFLKTLPSSEFSSGMAEVIKYGYILDADFLSYLTENHDLISGLDQGALENTIVLCCQHKANVVIQDEKEEGNYREILNFGHTFAHAVESLTEYKEYLHGEAVALGLLVAGQLSVIKGFVENSYVERLCTLLKLYDLPVALKADLDKGDLVCLMKNDKKNIAGEIRYVLAQDEGSVFISDDIDELDILEAIEYVR